MSIRRRSADLVHKDPLAAQLREKATAEPLSCGTTFGLSYAD
jgi:hypothetical protein